MDEGGEDDFQDRVRGFLNQLARQQEFYRERLQTQSHFADGAVISISGAGVAASLAALKHFAESPIVSSLVPLEIAISLWALTLVSQIISYKASIRVYRLEINRLDRYLDALANSKDDLPSFASAVKSVDLTPFRSVTGIFSSIALFSFVSACCCMVWFGFATATSNPVEKQDPPGIQVVDPQPERLLPEPEGDTQPDPASSTGESVNPGDPDPEPGKEIPDPTPALVKPKN